MKIKLLENRSLGGVTINILGSNRIVTQDYNRHRYAEDYAGVHLSDIKIFGRAKVIRVVNKYIPYEDTIDYNDYLKNRQQWQDGTYYNCISISGKKSRYHQSELGGNQVELECYEGNKKRFFKMLHIADVLVKVGDIIDSNTIIGKQGNTGLVLSNKSRSDITYGTHVHFEVRDENYNSINPRDYALFNIKVDYREQTNEIDNSKKQIKILVDKINIRQSHSTNSNIIGGVYKGEIYTVVDEQLDNKYNWYKIKTSLGLTGFVANEKGKQWIEISEPNQDIEESHQVVDEITRYKLVFTCPKDGMYAIKLYKGEKLYLNKDKENN